MAEDPKINQSCMAIADDLWLNRYNNDDAVKQGDIETMLELNKQNLIKDVWKTIFKKFILDHRNVFVVIILCSKNVFCHHFYFLFCFPDIAI